MRNILKKTAIATAMGAALATAPAMAVDFDFQTGEGTFVMADVIFGNGNPGTGSEETLAAVPGVVFDITEGDTVAPDYSDDTDQAIIKFTLGGKAVFGEDNSTTALLDGANTFSITGSLPALAITDTAYNANIHIGWSVDSGGAIDDNTIIIKIDIPAGENVQSVTYDGFSAKNLTSALNPSVRENGGYPLVEYAVEYVEAPEAALTNAMITDWAATTAFPIHSLLEDPGAPGTYYRVTSTGYTSAAAIATDVTSGDLVLWTIVGDDGVDVTATDDALPIFGSQPPLSLGGTVYDYSSGFDFVRINVGTEEEEFTDEDGLINPQVDDEDGRSDFSPDNDVTTINLGSLKLTRDQIVTSFSAAYFGYPSSLGGAIKKENGSNFDFNGADDHFLTISAANGTFQEDGTLYLAENTDCTSVFASTGDITEAEYDAGSATMAVSGNTTELETTYYLCYDVTGDAGHIIPEATGITATWDVVFFNDRYDNPSLTKGTYGPIIRNGCLASFFNIPASNNTSDEAFVRLTNTSGSGNEGKIRGTMYDQEGAVIGSENTIVADTLVPHATQVFWTGDDDIPVTGQRDILSIEKAFGVGPADFGAGGSRARLILKGAFDTCEGMGLIRVDGGSLFNMTSTTMGNEAASPNDGNNGN